MPTRVFLACGVTDMRKGFDGLAVLVQQVLAQNPHSGALFAFRGKRGHLVKLLWFDGQGLCLFSKRLDRGRFVWPVTATGTVTLTPALARFLGDGRLEIDNNIAERALRGVAVGRRNWLFAGSRAGGERAAAIYTVIQTCKANGVDPQAYIADVIARVAGDWPASRWDELMPWNWSPEPARLAA